jgi:hypothetical protein
MEGQEGVGKILCLLDSEALEAALGIGCGKPVIHLRDISAMPRSETVLFEYAEAPLKRRNPLLVSFASIFKDRRPCPCAFRG